MNFLENLLNAFQTIFANKLRSGLTMLGIIIGVSSVVIMISIGEGAQQGVTSRIEGLGTNLIIITPGSSTQTNVRSSSSGNTDSLTKEDIQGLEALETLSGVSPEYSGRKQAIYKTQNSNVTITGVLPAYESVRNFKTEYGQFISSDHQENVDRVAVVGTDIVTNLFEGKNPIGQDIRIENNIFTIIGVMEEKESSGFQSQNNVIFIPLSTAQKRVFGTSSISNIYVSAKDANMIDDTVQEVTYALLMEHGIANEADADFTVLNQADALETLNEVTQIFTLLLGGIAGISLLVGGIGVMNIMLVSVTERTREIGIRKAIGAKEKDILFQFLTESILLSITGGIIGIVFSIGCLFIVKSFAMEISMSIDAMILAFVFSASVGVFFGAFPAYQAGKLKPIDALRFE